MNLQLLWLILLQPVFAVTASLAHKHRRSSKLRASARIEASVLHEQVGEAVNAALGCGGHVSADGLRGIELEISDMWKTMPKNEHGRVDPRPLRMLMHRYFDRKFSLHIRGMERAQLVNETGWASTDILSQMMPAYLERVAESERRRERGFTKKDAAHLIAVLDHLIFDSESALLEIVYDEQRLRPASDLSHEGLRQVLEKYMIRWLFGEDEESLQEIQKNENHEELMNEVVPHWGDIVEFLHGQVVFTGWRRRNALSERFSYDEAHAIVGGITKSFASYWESVCTEMSSVLIDMDTHHTGRVPLSKFYSFGLQGEGRFSESEEYLRKLGVLDESSAWRGAQVIVPNYIQGASNCIVAAPHYLVCCRNECEDILAQIEGAIQAPMATPGQLVAVVTNMSSVTSLDDDVPIKLGSGSNSLLSQLHQIADEHQGQVPLHGRLFAQWLHYVFPRECIFPHKSGSVPAALTPTAFGSAFSASEQEMKRRAFEPGGSDWPGAVDKGDLQWMSQWTSEEELLDENRDLLAPWEASLGFVNVSALLVLAVTALAAHHFCIVSRLQSSSAPSLPMHGKRSHVF